MEIQKKNGNEISFDFLEESFIYKLKESSGTRTMTVRYLGVDIVTIDEFIERNEWFRNVGIFWIVIAVGIFVTTQKGSMWLLLGAGMLMFYYLRTTRYSSLQSDDGGFLIIRDKKHDTILEKIRSEKRKILREKYFFINSENTLEQETLKYEYLRDDGAITQEEFVEINETLLRKNGVIKTIPTS